MNSADFKPLYNSYRTYLKKRFGGPVLKIPLNGGFSCPNRDGAFSYQGCYFCDNRSFSPVSDCKEISSLEQLRLSIEKDSGRHSRFLPYLQPFSNTYGTVGTLQRVYEPLISEPGSIGIAIGTRPDCFTSDIYDYLSDIAARTYVSVELGVQSGNNNVLHSVNRGHTWEDFEKTVEYLSKRNIETVAHIMLGLPGESEDSMIATACKLARMPVQGVKIHQLMIIEGTEFEKIYKEKKLEVLTLENYTRLVSRFLEQLRPDQHIHRLMANSRREFGLLAPDWSEKKTESMNYIQNFLMKTRNIRDQH